MAATSKCSYCRSDIDLALGEHRTDRHNGRRVIFCDDDCHADYFRPDDQEPIDYDEQDRMAYQSELIENMRNER